MNVPRGIALHATRQRRVDGVLARGLERPGCAYFVLSVLPDLDPSELEATLPVAIYFSLSLRTVTEWLSPGTPERSYAEWYERRIAELPALIPFQVETEQSDDDRFPARYVSWVSGNAALTAPYRKLESDPVPPSHFVFAPVAVTLADIASAEERVTRDRVAPLLDPRLMPKPFFAKARDKKQRIPPAPTPRIDVPPLAANVPALCAALGDRVLTRVAALLHNPNPRPERARA